MNKTLSFHRSLVLAMVLSCVLTEESPRLCEGCDTMRPARRRGPKCFACEVCWSELDDDGRAALASGRGQLKGYAGALFVQTTRSAA
jgi:hypothetical protein